MSDSVDTCPKCGRLNQMGHVCPISPDAPAMPPGYHPTAGFLKHPQDAVVTHPQDVAAEGAIAPAPAAAEPGTMVASSLGERLGEQLEATRHYRSLPAMPAPREQLPLPGVPAPKGPPPGVSLPPDWDGAELGRADIASAVAEDMARTNARASQEAMESLASMAGQILTRGETFKERLMHQLLVRVFMAGASLGAQMATERAIQYGLFVGGAGADD